MVLAANFALGRRVALWGVALVFSFVVLGLNRSAWASASTLMAQASKSQDVTATNGAGPCQVARQYVSLKPASFIQEGNECVMELETKDSKRRFVLTAIDHFTVDQNGKATHFVVYFRPGVPLPNLKDIGK